MIASRKGSLKSSKTKIRKLYAEMVVEKESERRKVL